MIGERAIHCVLLEEILTVRDPSKGIRYKPWVRYEREEILYAVHMDWHTSKYNGKQVCVVLDDASRMILAGGEFDSATAEISIQLLREVYERYAHIYPIREIITDHGRRFYANTRDWSGNADHSFEQFCKGMDLSIFLQE